MTYIEWTQRHPQAAAELEAIGDMSTAAPAAAGSEAASSAQVRLEASRLGWGCWRNSKGVLPNPQGRPVRFGLANDSKAVGAAFRSGDLILCIPRVVQLADVGSVIGQFGSAEVKRAGWRYTGTEHEVGQANWQRLVRKYGGWAGFCTGPRDLPTN